MISVVGSLRKNRALSLTPVKFTARHQGYGPCTAGSLHDEVDQRGPIVRHKVEATPPVTKLRSVAQLMMIATAMNQRAARRYRHLAETMEAHRNPEVAGVFRRLAEDEEGRAAAFARRLNDPAAPTPHLEEDRWDFPEIFGENVEDDGGGPYLMTAYRALCMVVRDKERAFAYYTDVASHTRLCDIGERAEELAKDVLDQVIGLRLERRRAFRAEHKATTMDAASVDLRSVADFVAAAESLETTAAQRHAALAAVATALGDDETARLLHAITAEEEASARVFAGRAESREPAIAAGGRPGETEDLSTFEILRLGLRIVGERFDTLAALADRAEDESVMREAETLAEKLLPRLTMIRGRLDQIA